MLTSQELTELGAQLYVYDVEQGAWEQERNGLEANAGHVLTHLSKDLIGKDFTDRHTLESAIAPDCLQYALRLARWNVVMPSDMYPDRTVQASIEEARTGNLKFTPSHFGLFVQATGTLALALHDLDHESQRAKAISEAPSLMKLAGRLLVLSAITQSNKYEFNLVESFSARLDTLRARFGIPQP